VLVSFGKVDEELFEELEEILITSDVGFGDLHGPSSRSFVRR
jgi:signal recognition particle GTPase